MSYIIFDVIRRYIKFAGYKLKFVQNFTDIDDKIIDRANRKGIAANELAQFYSDEFLADMDALNVVRADFYPRRPAKSIKSSKWYRDLSTMVMPMKRTAASISG